MGGPVRSTENGCTGGSIVQGTVLTQELAALQSVLRSKILYRAPNMARILEYVCRKHLEGRGEQIKEYTIAIEALGTSRRPSTLPLIASFELKYRGCGSAWHNTTRRKEPATLSVSCSRNPATTPGSLAELRQDKLSLKARALSPKRWNPSRTKRAAYSPGAELG